MKQKIIFKKWKITKKSYTGSISNKSFDYAIVSLSSLKISESCCNTIFFYINKICKKKIYHVCTINKNQTLTTKSLGIRMGKGKGSKKKTIYLINAGDCIFSGVQSFLRTQKDYKLFKGILNKKLPFYTQTFYNKNIYLNL